jgi:hypothetical protein
VVDLEITLTRISTRVIEADIIIITITIRTTAETILEVDTTTGVETTITEVDTVEVAIIRVINVTKGLLITNSKLKANNPPMEIPTLYPTIMKRSIRYILWMIRRV